MRSAEGQRAPATFTSRALLCPRAVACVCNASFVHRIALNRSCVRSTVCPVFCVTCSAYRGPCSLQAMRPLHCVSRTLYSVHHVRCTECTVYLVLLKSCDLYSMYHVSRALYKDVPCALCTRQLVLLSALYSEYPAAECSVLGSVCAAGAWYPAVPRAASLRGLSAKTGE